MARAWRSGIYKDGRAIPVTIIYDEMVNQIRKDTAEDTIKVIHSCVVANYANMVIPAGSTPEVGRRLGELKKVQI